MTVRHRVRSGDSRRAAPERTVNLRSPRSPAGREPRPPHPPPDLSRRNSDRTAARWNGGGAEEPGGGLWLRLGEIVAVQDVGVLERYLDASEEIG
eukprot:746322-Hanusia_phi.AAC.1